MTFNQRYFSKDKSNSVNLHSVCCFKGLERTNKMIKNNFSESHFSFAYRSYIVVGN